MRTIKLLIIGLLNLPAFVFAQCSIPIDVERETVSGALLQAVPCADGNVLWLGQSIEVKKDQPFVIGLGRDQTGTILLAFELGDVIGNISIEARARDYDLQIVNGVPQKTVTPNPEQQARARADAQAVAEARRTVVDSKYWRSKVQAPAEGRISGVYGSQRVYNGTPGRPHYGLDIAAPKGTDVVAPMPGVVILAQDLFYSGNTIILAHGEGLTSSFLHLDEISVNVGETIAAGQLMGKIGATGRATGPHLDWRMNWYSERVDPELLLNVGLPNTGAELIRPAVSEIQ